MDLLIKNMEMPNCCMNCIFLNILTCSLNGRAIDGETGFEKRQGWCPLVALPEHGELIDEDEFRLVIYREIRNHKEDEPITMILKGILWEMDNAPVIVEANNE